MKETLKKFWPHIAIILLFIGMATVYMSPELSGERIGATDNLNAHYAMSEALRFRAETGRQTWWTGSMYCGMPNYQIGGADYDATSWLSPIVDTLHKGYGSPICLMLLYLVCFYALMLSMKMGKWLSAIGAIALGLSSYFIVIIGTGHVTKATSIALMTLSLAGFYLIFHNYRKTGIVLCMIGTAAGFAPHPQMTYYLCFLFGAFGCAELWLAYKNKSWKQFAINSVFALCSLGIGVGTSIANTFANAEYLKESVRGGQSELKEVSKEKPAKTGLDFAFATAYSYGIDETFTFLIPNYMGGCSTYNLKLSEKEIARMQSEGAQYDKVQRFSESASMYWGEQSQTAGPVYMGAALLLLFVLALFIVQGPYKWALIAVTALSILLSWGYHLQWFTELFFDYFPLFNKFRAISSILVIAEIAMPILAIMGLRDFIKGIETNQLTKEKARKYILISAGITAGLCLLILIGASMFASFHSANEQLTEADGSVSKYISNLIYYRKMLFHNDVWRGIGIVIATATVMLTYLYGKLQKKWMLALMGGIILLDLWTVDKRYVNDSLFSTPADYHAYFEVQPWEKALHKRDSSVSFRVLNPKEFQDCNTRTSLRFKNVVGFHAAMLRRFDDIVRGHLANGQMKIYSMLNTKYIVQEQGADGQVNIATNEKAMGNAWFVDTLKMAQSPREEYDDLLKVDLHTTAIVGKDFASHVKNPTPGADSTATITMTKYEPDCVYYDAHCSKPGTVVFSEVYYPYGWKAYVDEKPVDHYRANYVLRALNLDAGNHKIRFEFRPESVEKGNKISMFFVIMMYLTMALCLLLGIKDIVMTLKAKSNESK